MHVDVPMPRYKLSTLPIVLALGQPVLGAFVVTADEAPARPSLNRSYWLCYCFSIGGSHSGLRTVEIGIARAPPMFRFTIRDVPWLMVCPSARGPLGRSAWPQAAA
jgi:hypothetical protein